MSIQLGALIWIVLVILTGVFARWRGRIFFGAFFISIFFTPIAGVLYCLVVPQFPFEKQKDTSLLVDLLIANVLAALLFFLPLGGWIESDFHKVFGRTVGTILCDLLNWAPLVVLALVALGNYLILGRLTRMRRERGASPASSPATIIALGWTFLVVLRVALLAMGSW